MDTEQQIEEAVKVLFVKDDEGEIVDKSEMYREYAMNKRAFDSAKSDFEAASFAASADPIKAQAWPAHSATLQQRVDRAWDAMATEDSRKIERALDTLHRLGSRSVQAHMNMKSSDASDV